MSRAAPLILLCAIVLAACSRSDAAGDVAAKREARARRAQALADQPPKVTRYRMEGGELVVIDIATVAPGGFADSQKCFLWRDSEHHSVSLQCPADTAAAIPPLGPEPDPPYRP